MAAVGVHHGDVKCAITDGLERYRAIIGTRREPRGIGWIMRELRERRGFKGRGSGCLRWQCHQCLGDKRHAQSAEQQNE